jgi:hypothetical protein
MKNYIKILFAAIPFLAIACNNDDTSSDVTAIKIAGIANDTLSIEKGEEPFQVAFETAPKNAELWCYTTNADVFTVTKEGLITPVAGGTANLLVTAPNGNEWTKTSCVVEIIEYLDSIQAKFSTASLIVDDTALAVDYFNFYPRTATLKYLKWTSSDPTVLSVDADGNLKGLKEGKAELSVKSEDGKGNPVSDVVTVSVKYVNVVSGTPKEGSLVTDRSKWIPSYGDGTRGDDPYRMIDGNTSTDFAGDNGPFWVAFDFGEELDLTGLSVRYWYYFYRATEAEILTSDDGKNWESQSSLALPASTTQYITLKNPVKARFIKFNMLKTYYGTTSITEFNVYAK